MADSSPSTQVQAPTSDASYNPLAGFLNAEARKTINSPTFQVGSDTVKLDTDTVIKRMLVKLDAVFDVTYGAGAPIFSDQGIFARICSNIEIQVGGNRTIKSLDPHLARMHAILFGGSAPRRAYTTGAAAPTSRRAGIEWFAGSLAYPVTTQFCTFNEAFPIYFENILGYGGSRQASELDIRDVSSATMKFSWLPLENVLEDGNAATVVYGNRSIQVRTQIIENRARPRPKAGDTLFDYVESSFSEQYSGPARNQQVNLESGNFLMGIGIRVQNGDANRRLRENLLTQMNLKINGATTIQGPVTHADLQDENLARYGADSYKGVQDLVVTPVPGNASLDGFAFMNLIRNGSWNTAINTSRAAGVDSVKLEFDTPAAAPAVDGATYTNPLIVTVHTHEMRPFAYTR